MDKEEKKRRKPKKKINKAVYTLSPPLVADGWAGARVLLVTDQPTNTASSRVACPRLKMTRQKG